jgi:hypothetical protein
MELLGLSFRPGLGVQSVIHQRFGLPVSPVGSSRPPFFLVASFGRCRFRLCPISVALIIQATIGGSAPDFNVIQLANRVFRFSVADKRVGFHIVKLGCFSSSCYKVFFHLWSNGGPHWDHEYAAYCREEASSWSEIRKVPSVSKQLSPITHSRKASIHRSFADAVKFVPLTGANKIPLRVSAFDRIQFPETKAQFGDSDNRHFHPVHASFRTRVGQADESRVNNASGPSLNLNSGQPKGTQYLSTDSASGICSRCLSDKHLRCACKSPIRCFACMSWGHIAVNCPAHNRKGTAFQVPSNSNKGKDSLVQPKWFSETAWRELGPGTSSPPSFTSFTDWWNYSTMSLHSMSPPKSITIPWSLPAKTMTADHGREGAHNTERQMRISTELTLGNSLPSQGKYIASLICAGSHTDPPKNPTHSAEINDQPGPQDEDQIPEQIQIQGQLPFDFFGLGQNVMEQQQEPPQQQIVPVNNVATPQDNSAWLEWPEVLPAAQQGQLAMEINLNAPPPVFLQDLNDLPMEDDPQDMLIHPGVQAIHGQINWELGQQMVQEILQPEPQKEVAEMLSMKWRLMRMWRFRFLSSPMTIFCTW